MTTTSDQTKSPKAPSAEADLDQLIAVLAVLGVGVRSPLQRMIDEESEATSAATTTGNPAVNAPAVEAPTLPSSTVPAPTSTTAEVAPAPTVTVRGQASANHANHGNQNTVLTPALVARALQEMGIDVGQAFPRPPTGGLSIAGDASHSLGGGGTAVMGASAVHNASPVVDKGKGVAPATSSLSTEKGPLVASANSTGFFCAGCGDWNLRPTSQTYYVVTVGLDVGIFLDWHTVSPLVTGVSGAIYKKYSSYEVAQAVFQEACAEGRVRKVAP